MISLEKSNRRAVASVAVVLAAAVSSCAHGLTAEQADQQRICRLHYETWAGDHAVTVRDDTAYFESWAGEQELANLDGDEIVCNLGTLGRIAGNRVELDSAVGTYVSTPIEGGTVSFEDVFMATEYSYNRHCSVREAGLAAAALLVEQQRTARYSRQQREEQAKEREEDAEEQRERQQQQDEYRH